MIHVQLPNGKSPAKVLTDVMYFAVKLTSQHFKGERYFKVDNNKEQIIQICVNGGNNRRGQPHLFGVYRIKYSTWQGNYNYHEGTHLDPINKEKWEEVFNNVSQKLI